MTKRITLKSGKEVIVNGYHVRAVGYPRQGNSLQVYRPEQGFGEHGETVWRMLYGGLGDDVLCRTSINIGSALDLASSDGWPKAVATATKALEG